MSNTVDIMPLEDFKRLTSEQQVEMIRQIRLNHNLKQIREAWKFKYPTQYYILLKKLGIYDQVVSKLNRKEPVAARAEREVAVTAYPTPPAKEYYEETNVAAETVPVYRRFDLADIPPAPEYRVEPAPAPVPTLAIAPALAQVPADAFNYTLNNTCSTEELAEKLERLAHFIRGEQKTATVQLTITL
jgi:hypothetical protein